MDLFDKLDYDVECAIQDLEPSVSDIWEKYGLETVLIALQYLTAKGILLSEGLTTKQKSDLLKEARDTLLSIAVQINKLTSNGSKSH